MTYRMLLATDGEEGAEEAIKYAIDIADIFGATLHILYVVDEAAYSAYSPEEFTEEEKGPVEALEKKGRAVIEDVAERAESQGVEVETTLRHGRPAEEIVAEADELDADSVTLGSRTMPDEYRERIGSVADEVLRLTDRNVTVVKTPVIEE